MIVLLQRVSQASVSIHNEIAAQINQGILVFVAIQKHDDENLIARMSERLLNYRIFADDAGKMNLGVMQVEGDLLLVPQFTLAADTTKGLRPNFSSAANPEKGKRLFDYFVNNLISKYAKVSTGVFAADMQVHLINEGPVTFWLEL